MENAILKEQLDICFKGSRSYVYASDVFMEIIRILKKRFNNSNISFIDFSTHKMATTKIEIEIFENMPERSETIHAVFNFSIDNKKYFGVLKETGEEITCRTEYPENEIFKTFVLDTEHKTVSTHNKFNNSIMDIFTSLNKYMLTALFPEITQGWLSVRTKIDTTFTQDYNILRVDFQKNFSNKYYQSALFVDNKQIGTLYFSIK